MPKTPYELILAVAAGILITLALITVACVWAAGLFSLLA